VVGEHKHNMDDGEHSIAIAVQSAVEADADNPDLPGFAEPEAVLHAASGSAESARFYTEWGKRRAEAADFCHVRIDIS
jgi:hypothetical protein